MSPPQLAQRRIGVVVPYDMALDRELWRWVPDDVSLHLTRTPNLGRGVTLQMVQEVSDHEVVAQGARDLAAIGPEVLAYACTSGSFVAGVEGERALVRSIESVAKPAVTTSGALLEALETLGVRTVAVVTPYEPSITDKLEQFLAQAGHAVGGAASMELTHEIWAVSYDQTSAHVRQADSAECEAVFVSCTNLPTYDLIGPLERELGKPVLTANQVTMWAALRRLGSAAVGPGQRLVEGDQAP